MEKAMAEVIGEVASNIEAFKRVNDERFTELERRLNLRGLFEGSGGPESPELAFKSATGRTFPLIRAGERLAERVKSSEADFDLAEFVHANIAGRSTKAVASGPALVDSMLSNAIIDDVRAATTVIRAGAQTVMIDGPTVMGRIAGDPAVHQHTEGANDVTSSDVTLDSVTLDPKALVATVPLTGEVLADSPNLNQVLQTSLVGAFAAKLDALTLATILADTDVPESAAGQDPAIWAKVLEAVAAAMAADQPVPTGMITNTADFIARASQLASTAGSWLGKPPALAGMNEFPTTAIAAGFAIFGGFAESVLIAMRQQLRFEVVRWHDSGRYSHLLVAHMRADGVVYQPKRLFRMLKTV